MNEASFLHQIELNFDSSLTGALTLYFMKEAGGWQPLHIVQLDRSQSHNDAHFISFGNLITVNSHNYDFKKSDNYT
jgi:hypothetical protein